MRISIVYCLLLSQRGCLHYFCFWPRFLLFLKCFSIRCCLGSSLQSGFTWGQSSWGPLVTAPTVVSAGLPLPPLAIPFVPVLLPGPRSSSLRSHPRVLVEHDQQQLLEKRDVAGGCLKSLVSENVLLSLLSRFMDDPTEHRIEF